jgi:hypothetical protein
MRRSAFNSPRSIVSGEPRGASTRTTISVKPRSLVAAGAEEQPPPPQHQNANGGEELRGRHARDREASKQIAKWYRTDHRCLLHFESSYSVGIPNASVKNSLKRFTTRAKHKPSGLLIERPRHLEGAAYCP